MIDSSALRAFRNTLALVPADWVLWALDADETYVYLEGPCLERIGVRAVDRLGRRLEEAYPDHPELVARARKYMQGPGTDRVVVNGHTLLLSGAPSRDGGCVGIGMLVEERPAMAEAACQVLELACDVPRVGGWRGDLLVVDPERPGRVGLYREVDLAQLGPELEGEVRGLSSPASPRTPPGAPRHGAGRHPARASHLRLLP